MVVSCCLVWGKSRIFLPVFRQEGKGCWHFYYFCMIPYKIDYDIRIGYSELWGVGVVPGGGTTVRGGGAV